MNVIITQFCKGLEHVGILSHIYIIIYIYIYIGLWVSNGGYRLKSAVRKRSKKS